MPEEPSTSLVRCVPRRWLQRTKQYPQQLWNDGGTGGRPGSFWSMSINAVMVVNRGHQLPSGQFFDFFKASFMATEGVVRD